MSKDSPRKEIFGMGVNENESVGGLVPAFAVLGVV
jgi:hypothetical protein